MARESTIWTAGAVWLAAVGGGLWAWERYDATPGPATVTPVEVEPGRWRLTVFAHPRCPCTRAMLGELGELVRTAPELSVTVLFVRPPGVPDGWERGASWDAATAVPGADVRSDPDGATARRFGAATSGHAVLTDPGGWAVFRGGLSRARGRAGASPGRRAVQEWVGGRTGEEIAPVFGCPLFGSEG